MKNTKIRTLLIVNLVSLMGFQVFVPVYALFASDIGATPAQTGLIWSLYSFVMAIAIFVLGKLENNFNKRRCSFWAISCIRLGLSAFYWPTTSHRSS